LDCRFTDADLKGIHLESQGRPHQFVRCNFQGAQFDASRIGFALFHECNLTHTHWTGARLERVRFSECVTDGVDWGGADLVETRVVGADKAELDAVPMMDGNAAMGVPVGGTVISAPETSPPVGVVPEAQQGVSPPGEPPARPVSPTEIGRH
jgi:hypothetical protein